MINTYEEKKNPCVLCVDTLNSDNVNVKQDYLEFSLDGKGATLVIREVSVEDINQQPKEEEIQEPEKPPEDEAVRVPSHISSEQTSPRTEVSPWFDVGQKVSQGRHAGLHALYTKKWSGKTYYEEEFRKLRLKEYMKEVNVAERKRHVWKQFKKEIEKDKIRDLIKGSGPEWWQEPSRKQICLVTSLCDVIKADHEEGVTGRTRQWLLDLGVTTRVTPGQVRSCMKRSLLNPEDFLLEVHAVILKSQMKKKRGNLQKPFSGNERLLLSAVCVLHLPVLLTMLHFILPPPKPFSEAKHIQEILFGDLEDERIRYSTPYMEPLPFRSKTQYHSWALDKVFMALLPSLLLDDSGNERSSLDPTGRAISSMVGSFTGKDNVDNKSELAKTVDSSVSVGELISHCVSSHIDTLKSHLDEGSDTKRSFTRNISGTQVKHQRESYRTRFEGGSGYFGTETSFVVNPELPDSNNIVNITDTYLSVRDDSNFWSQPQLDSTIVQSFADLRLSSGVVDSPDQLQEVEEQHMSVIFGENNLQTYTDRLSHEDFQEQDLGYRELQKLCEEIRELPREKQLRSALKILSDLGDPLAQLPKLHKLPAIQRWLEIRRGKRRILSEEVKQTLLQTSRGMWKTAMTTQSTKGPKLDIPKREERLLTWDRKKWLNSQVKRELLNYNSRLRQEKVDNARYFFPAMLNHYDHGSKLNRNFRDLYFTYFPSREADIFPYRPWKPNEIKNSKVM
uniref:DUF4771 domain-containing protein n=1 Tax=Homalodisca liturata TaxID=320908 RepID=A0A1B6J5R0_9HEMI